MFRGYLTRMRLLRQREVEVRELRSEVLSTWQPIKINMLDFGVLVLRRLFDLNPSILPRCSFYQDELQYGLVRQGGGRCRACVGAIYVQVERVRVEAHVTHLYLRPLLPTFPPPLHSPDTTPTS